MQSTPLARYGPWVLLLVPLTFVLVYAGRDIPAPSECWGSGSSPDEVARYRRGSYALFVAAEALVLGVYVGALRAARIGGSRPAAWTVPLLAAGLGVAVAWVLERRSTGGIAPLLPPAAVVAAVAALLLGWLASATYLWALAAAAALVAVVALYPTFIAAFVAAHLPVPFAVVTALAAVGATGTAAVRLRGEQNGLGSLAAAAAFIVLVALPLALLIVRTRGDQPVFC